MITILVQWKNIVNNYDYLQKYYSEKIENWYFSSFLHSFSQMSPILLFYQLYPTNSDYDDDYYWQLLLICINYSKW